MIVCLLSTRCFTIFYHDFFWGLQQRLDLVICIFNQSSTETEYRKKYLIVVLWLTDAIIKLSIWREQNYMILRSLYVCLRCLIVINLILRLHLINIYV